MFENYKLAKKMRRLKELDSLLAQAPAERQKLKQKQKELTEEYEKLSSELSK